MKIKMLGFAVMALLATALLVVPTQATSLQTRMDFSGGSSATSSMSFTTAVGNTFSVTNALINAVTALPADKILSIADGTLSFTTAGCTSGCFANTISGGFNTTAVFAYGGTLQIIGELAGMSTPQTLLMGTFSPAGLNSSGSPGAVAPNVSLNSVTGKGGFNGSLAISKINPAIYSAFAPLMFKTPSPNGQGYLSELLINLSFAGMPTGVHTATGTWSGTINGSDLLVQPIPQTPIPEGSTLLLLGSALLAASKYVRRKMA